MRSDNSFQNFTPPQFWSFPPFFTLQPVLETKEKQLKLWREIILNYCIQNNLYRIIPQNFAYFCNPSIDRKLTPEAIETVVLFLIKSGNAEWEDEGKTSLRIMWKSPEALAGEMYHWAYNCDEPLGTVFTIYELHSGEDYKDSGFYGTDSSIIRKALNILEISNKCVVIRGSVPDEDGVKFLSV